MTSAIRTVKDRHNPEASHIISSSRHQTTNHQQSPEQQQAVLLPHPDHTTMQHGSGVVHATAAAALPAATPAPGMPAAPAATVTGKSGATQSPSRLDAALAKQQYALEPLLPTPTNINPVHLPRSDLLHFVALQSWVSTNLNMQLPLLNGMFVLVPSSTQQSMSKVLQAACGYSPTESSAFVATLCATIPWRLRQVSSVEVAPNGDPADATVVLVGGDRVRAGAVKEGLLAEAQEYQYLCCEVADLQRRRQLRLLRVCDVAHMAWRLRVACDLDGAGKALEQELLELAACSCDPATISKARTAGLESARGVLMQLPPDDWVAEQILQYVELNPLVWPESPDQPWQLLSAAKLTQLLQDAAAAWQHYVQQRLAGQQPRPVTDWVPWLPVDAQAGPMPHATEGPPVAELQQHVAQPPSAVEAQQPGMVAPAQAPFRANKAEQAHPSTTSQHNVGLDCSDSLRAGHLADNPHNSSNTAGQHSPAISQQPVRDRSGDQLFSGDPHTSSTLRGTHSTSQRDPRSSSSGGSRSSSPSTSRRRRRSLSHTGSYSRSVSRGASSSYSESGDSAPRPSKPLHSRSRSYSRGRAHQQGTSASPDSREHRSSVCERHRRWDDKARVPKTGEHRAIVAPSSCVGRTAKSIACSMVQKKAAVQASCVFDPSDPWSQYVERQAQQYLQQLAVTITEASGAPRKPGHPSDSMGFGWLRDRLPLPPLLLSHYGSVSKLFKVRRELQIVPGVSGGALAAFRLLPEHYARLLAAANQGAQQLQHQQSQDTHIQEADADSSDWPQYLQPQQHYLEAAAAADTAAAALAVAAAAAAGPGDSNRTASRHDSVEEQVQAWLQRLAVLLGPVRETGEEPNNIKLITIKHKLPVPAAVVQWYGTVQAFVTARVELEWVDGMHSFALHLERSYHRQLVEEAKAAGVNGNSGICSLQQQFNGSDPDRSFDAHIRRLTQEWLQQLAVLLQPVRQPPSRPNYIKLYALRQKLPLPSTVYQHHGSMASFLEATPELQWAETGSAHQNHICLVPKYHEMLLQAADDARRDTVPARRSSKGH